jgi:translation initiation factor IF-2
LTNIDDNKDKLRVYEYAKSLNMNSKEIITILKRLNIPVNNHMSVMENETVIAVERFFHDIKSKSASKKPGSDMNSTLSNQNKPTAPKETVQGAISASTDSSNTSKEEVPFIHKVSREDLAEQRLKAQEQLNKLERQQSQQTKPSRPSSSYSAGRTSQSPSTQSSSPTSIQRNSATSTTSADTINQAASTTSSSSTSSTSSTSSSTGRTYTPSNRPANSTSQQRNNNYPSRTQSTASGTGAQRPAYSDSNNQRNNSSSTPRFNKPDDKARTTTTNKFVSNNTKPARSFPPSSNAGASSSSSTKNADSNRSAQNARNKNTFADKKTVFTKSAEDTNAKPFKSFQKRYDDGSNAYNKLNPRNNKNRNQNVQKKEKVDNTPKKIIVRGSMTVGETAKLLHKDASEVIKKLFTLGVMATINNELELDAIQLVADAFNVEVEMKIVLEDDRFETVEETDDEQDLIDRPPVVTIMGHVDHGKTTLLDAIRHTNVTVDEAGGITQHIGAYQVEVNQKKITFLDTPGHEAFTTMRARGAQVTDITILVVAADDGVMPQTIEAINHAKAAKVPIIVAVNKIDKPGANTEKIKQSLTEYELVPEEWGGETIFCELSAKNKVGIENLLEMILLVAEVQEYKSNPNKRARGTVIEAELDKGRGPVARILIQHGTLKVGDSFVAGVHFGRVRAMVNDRGKKIKEASPSTPIEITGLSEVPQAGDPFLVFEDERKAREIAQKRSITLRQTEMTANSRVTLDDLYKQISDGDIKDLNVIIKGDVQGSVEALRGSLEKIEVEGARVKIIHSGVGTITETDVSLASASSAIIIGFNVKPEAVAKTTAEQEKIDIRLHTIIYHVIEEITFAMKGILDPIFKETIIGHAQVRNVFKITGSGMIAGCMVTDGKMTRNAGIRLLREGTLIHSGKLDSLKRFKDDVKEVAQGYECGISLERFVDIKDGDIIEAFILEAVER